MPSAARPPTELVDDLERVVVASVALTARVLAEVAPELTFVQWRVLVVLGEDAAGAGLPVGQIASELGAKLPAVSRVVGRLRNHGLAETARDRADARVSRVALTESGRTLRAAVVGQRRREMATAIESHRLTRADAGRARRIAAALESIR